MIEGLVEEGMPPFDIRNWTEQVLVHTIGHGCGIMGNATNAIFHNFPLSSGTSCFLNKLIHTSFIHLLGWPLTSSLVTLLVMICNFLFVSIPMAKYLTNHCWCYEPTLPNAKSSSFSSTLLIGINSCQPRNIAAFSYPNAHSGGRPKFSPETTRIYSKWLSLAFQVWDVHPLSRSSALNPCPYRPYVAHTMVSHLHPEAAKKCYLRCHPG